MRLVLALGDTRLEARVAGLRAAVVATVRDAADLLRHARPEVAEGVVLSARLPGAGPGLIDALPPGWCLLLLPGPPGRAAAALLAATLRRPGSRVLLPGWGRALGHALAAPPPRGTT